MPDYEWDLGRWERQVSTTATSAPAIGDDVAGRLELKDPLTAQSRCQDFDLTPPWAVATVRCHMTAYWYFI